MATATRRYHHSVISLLDQLATCGGWGFDLDSHVEKGYTFVYPSACKEGYLIFKLYLPKQPLHIEQSS